MGVRVLLGNRRLLRHFVRRAGLQEALRAIRHVLLQIPEEELIRVFGSPDNCRRMPDEVMQRLAYIPAGWRVEETHIAVYRSRNGEAKFVKGKAPAYLLRGSIVTPSLEAAIINAIRDRSVFFFMIFSCFSFRFWLQRYD